MYNDVAKGLRKIFEERSINIKRFAEKNDIKPITLYRALNCNTDRMSLKLFKSIADGFGMTLDELYEVVVDTGGDGEDSEE